LSAKNSSLTEKRLKQHIVTGNHKKKLKTVSAELELFE
jgi:hypothetical protein